MDGKHARLGGVGIAAVVLILAVGSGLLLLTDDAEASMEVEWGIMGGSGELGENETFDEIMYEAINGKVFWEDLPEMPDEVRYEVEVRSPDGEEWETLDEGSGYIPDGPGQTAEEGRAELSLHAFLFEETSWSAEMFDPEPGEEVTHSAEHRLTVTIEDEDGEVMIEETYYDDVSWTVSRVESGNNNGNGNDAAIVEIRGDWITVGSAECEDPPCHFDATDWY